MLYHSAAAALIQLITTALRDKEMFVCQVPNLKGGVVSACCFFFFFCYEFSPDSPGKS